MPDNVCCYKKEPGSVICKDLNIITSIVSTNMSLCATQIDCKCSSNILCYECNLYCLYSQNIKCTPNNRHSCTLCNYIKKGDDDTTTSETDQDDDDTTAFNTDQASFPLSSDVYYSERSIATIGLNPNIDTTTRTERTALPVTININNSVKSAATYGITYNKGDNQTGKIVGGVIGGVVGLVLIGILVFLGFYWRKKKKVVNAIYTEAPYMGTGVYDIDAPSAQPNQARIHSMYPPNHEADSPYDNPVLPIVNDKNAKDFELLKKDQNYDYDNLGNIEEDGEEKEEGEEKKNDPYSRVLPPPRHR